MVSDREPKFRLNLREPVKKNTKKKKTFFFWSLQQEKRRKSNNWQPQQKNEKYGKYWSKKARLSQSVCLKPAFSSVQMPQGIHFFRKERTVFTTQTTVSTLPQPMRRLQWRRLRPLLQTAQNNTNTFGTALKAGE